MAIPQHTIDQILDRTDLVELIGQRVKLKKTGRSYSGCCPFHQEKTPSFHVYRDKGYYHCFGCQANGNAIRFLMDIDSRNFIDVMQELSSKAGIELPKDHSDNKKLSYKRTPQKLEPKAIAAPEVTSSAVTQQDQDPNQAFADAANLEMPAYLDDPFAQFDSTFSPFEDIPQEGNLYDLLENVAQFYERQLPHSKKAQSYFKQRGLTTETIQFWRLGYAPEDWQHLEKAFPQDIDGLKKVGLIRSSDNGRDFDLLRERVIFPIRDQKGRVVGFGGRALNDEIKPKYINSPDSDIFHKNQLLYGLYEGRKLKAHDWLMVEGYMDVIALQQYGVYGAVATLGTASNADHLTTLFKQNPRITIAFDGDAAGQKAARRTLEIALPLLNDGRELKFFVLPHEHDPDSLIRREGLESFNRLLDQAPLLSDFVFAHLTGQHDISSPEGKSLVMGELKALTELLPKHGSFRYLLTQSFREKLGLGRKWTPQISHDASLSFNIQLKDADFALALIVANPYLYTHFEILRAYIDQEEVLGDILFRIDRIFENLPEDHEQAIYYVLGACNQYCKEIDRCLNSIDVFSMLTSPEKAFNHAKEYSLGLQDTYLRRKLKKANTLQEITNLRQQLNELTKQISLRLIS